jgi:beta-lactamase regulating signal transducer with metallopeptidase domain
VTLTPPLDVWLGLAGVLAGGTAAIVAVAVILARIVRGAAWRRTVWQVATAAMLVLLAVEATGIGCGVAAWLAPRRPPDGPAAVPENVVRAAAVLSSHREARPVRSPVEPFRASEAFCVSGAAMEGSAAAAESAALTAAGDGSESPSAGWWPGGIWLIGAVAVLGRVVVARVFLVVFRLRHRAMGEGDLVGRVRALARRLGMRRRVRVVESARLTAPIAFGIVRPTIGLPRGFTSDFSTGQQNAILGHELAHLAWHDPAWRLMADLVTAALWWHPAAWWSRRRLQVSCETAADEACLMLARGPQLLAASLVELGKRLVRPRAAAWLGVGGGGFRSGLGRRVEQLLRLDSSPRRRSSRVGMRLLRVTGPVALLCVVLLCTAWARPVQTREGDPDMKSVTSMWKHSIAGAVLLTALGAGSDAALADDGERERPAEKRVERDGERREEGERRRDVRRQEGGEERRREGGEERRREGGEERREPRREVDGQPVRVREGDRERREGEGRKEEAEGRRDRPSREGERDERQVYKAKLLERIKGLERLKALALKAKDEKAVAFVNTLLGETREQLGKLTKEIERRGGRREGEGEPKEERKREGEGERKEVDGRKVRTGEGDREERRREGDRERGGGGGRKDRDREGDERGEGEGTKERKGGGDSVRTRWWEPSKKE